MRALLIEIRSTEIVDVPEDPMGALTYLKDLVGGWIESIPMPMNCHAFINEEGKLIGLPINPLATTLYNLAVHGSDMVAGNAVVFGPPNEDGDETPVTDEFLTFVKEIRK